MKKCLAIFIGVALSMSVSAQILSRTFFQAGGTVGLDFAQFSGRVAHENKQVVHKQVNFATLALGARLNVFELSNTFSIALATQPLLSFGKAYNKSTGGGTNFSLRIPCTIDFNIGHGATSKARTNRGVVLGAGVQWVNYPLFGGGVPIYQQVTSGGQPYFINMNTNWWEPVAHIGIRSARKHFYSNEVNIRAAYVTRDALKLGSDANTPENSHIRGFERFSIMLSLLMFLNY